MDAISNATDDEGAKITAVGIVTSFAAVTVGARLYVRQFMIRRFGWDVGGLFVAEPAHY
jgi:hypothetical protein